MKSSEIKVGDRFGKWAVLGEAPRRGSHRALMCKCECGMEKGVSAYHLASGKSRSCNPCATITHGKAYSKTYTSWVAMHGRCSNQRLEAYARYGGRGIVVCQEWASFEQFLEDMGERPLNKTLERKDNNLGYCKENCKWATRKEQSNNKSDNRLVVHEGREYTVAQLAEHLGVNYRLMHERAMRGDSISRRDKAAVEK